jgi:hypothetical protein
MLIYSKPGGYAFVPFLYIFLQILDKIIVYNRLEFGKGREGILFLAVVSVERSAHCLYKSSPYHSSP